MRATYQARSVPYRELRATDKICTRCGIVFGMRSDRFQHTDCIDCRPPTKRKPRN